MTPSSLPLPCADWSSFAAFVARGPDLGSALAQAYTSGSLAQQLPEVAALYGVPQVPLYHPEVDTGLHMELAMAQAGRLAPGDPAVAFAVLVHDLGKALTPESEWPKHPLHEERGVEPVEAVCQRWGVPEDVRRLALDVCVHHLNAHRVFETRTGTLLALLNTLDAWGEPSRFERWIVACQADKRGRAGNEAAPYPQAEHFRAVVAAVARVPFRDDPETTRNDQLRAVQAVHGPKRRPEPPRPPRAGPKP